MAQPTVGVVIPAHPARLKNGMLEQALRSVQQQTRPPDAVYVRVDNGGDGAAATRQRALMDASTDFVLFLDSDDIMLPKHTEWLLKHQQETGADFVYSWFRVLQQFADGTTNVLEDDPVFPVTHYLNPWDPDDPIETTITTLVRTDLAQKVGFRELNRGESNSGEDRFFTLGCMEAGAHISHLVRKSWLWRHWQLPNGTPGNTSGRSTKGDAAAG